LVTPVPLSPLLLLCCAYGGGSIKILLQAMPYITFKQVYVVFWHIDVFISDLYIFLLKKKHLRYFHFFCENKCIGYLSTKLN
jgi:hypothetical protein